MGSDDLTLSKDGATITHSGGGTGLTILSTNQAVTVESVVFTGGAVTGVTTAAMSDDLTSSKNGATITHSGGTGLTIASTSHAVTVESVVFTGGVVTGVSALTASGTITGATLTDGTFSVNSGAVTGVSALTASGSITGGTLT